MCSRLFSCSVAMYELNLKMVWRAVGRQVCVCVGGGGGACMPMEYISLLEDGCYLHVKEWNCGLFLINHLASGCATLQLVAGKEVSLTITSK